MMAPARDRKRVDPIRLGGEEGGANHDPESPKKGDYRLWFSKKSSPKVIYAGMGLVVLLSWMAWSKFLSLDKAAHGTTSEKTTSLDHSLVDFGNRKVSSLILNIGSNSDPIVPRPKDDPCVIAIAFEPMVPHTIKPHPALHVVAAAVTGEDNTTTGGGLATMRFYNDNGISSSLSTPTESSYWNDKEKRRGDGSIRVVPTLSNEVGFAISVSLPD